MVARSVSRTESPALPPKGSTPYADELDWLTLIGVRPRLLFILGERKSGGIEDLTPRVQAESEAVLNGGSFSPLWERLLRPLGAWSYGMHHHVRHLFLIDDTAVATGLRRVSVVSLGRAGECDAAALRKIVEQTEPDLIVCAGSETVYWPLVGRLELDHELLTTMYGEAVYYSLVHTGARQSVLLDFWDPSVGYFITGGHHHLFKLFLHAYDALRRKRILSCG